MSRFAALALIASLPAVALACSKDAPQDQPAPAKIEPAAAVAPATVAAPVPAAEPSGRITFGEPRPAAPAGETIGQRCALEGAPLDGDYQHNGLSLAAATDGRLYVADSAGVRRYQAKDGAGCTLALDAGFGTAGVLPLPDIEPAPQVVGEGPLYMQTGVSWKLAAGPDGQVYLYDLLRGVVRIDQGKVVARCPKLQGAMSLALSGKQAYVGRGRGEKLALASCKTSPAGLEPGPLHLHEAGGALWGAVNGKTLVRYDGAGKAAATIASADDAFKPGGFCSISAVAGCGDAICVVDNNCTKIERFSRDGAFLGELDAEHLFADRPFMLVDAATAPDGALWIVAAHKDGEHLEGAVYRVPVAAL